MVCLFFPNPKELTKELPVLVTSHFRYAQQPRPQGQLLDDFQNGGSSFFQRPREAAKRDPGNEVGIEAAMPSHQHHPADISHLQRWRTSMESHNCLMWLFIIILCGFFIMRCSYYIILCGFFIMCCSRFITFCGFFIMSCNALLTWCVFIMTLCNNVSLWCGVIMMHWACYVILCALVMIRCCYAVMWSGIFFMWFDLYV